MGLHIFGLELGCPGLFQRLNDVTEDPGSSNLSVLDLQCIFKFSSQGARQAAVAPSITILTFSIQAEMNGYGQKASFLCSFHCYQRGNLFPKSSSRYPLNLLGYNLITSLPLD